MQYNHDLWQATQHVKLGKVGKVRLTVHEIFLRGTRPKRHPLNFTVATIRN